MSHFDFVNQSKTNTRRHKQNNNKTTDQYKQRQHVLKIMLISQTILNKLKLNKLAQINSMNQSQ